MIAGPGASILHRGNSYKEFIEKLSRYISGWSDLQWTSQKLFGLPGTVTIQWCDGAVPNESSFMGESGGCVYYVFPPSPWSTHWTLCIFRPPSVRTGREGPSQYLLKLSFAIRAVAIDVVSKEIVLLERSFVIPAVIQSHLPVASLHPVRPQTGDVVFHFYNFENRQLRSPYVWHANWPWEVIVRQFEVVDGMLGILTAAVIDVSRDTACGSLCG